MMHTEALRLIPTLRPEEWLTLWRTVWFDLPAALAGGFDRSCDAPGARHARIPDRPGSLDLAKGAPGAGMGRAPATTRAGTHTFGSGTLDSDPLEELRAGCFA